MTLNKSIWDNVYCYTRIDTTSPAVNDSVKDYIWNNISERVVNLAHNIIYGSVYSNINIYTKS
jgi:hypothetical protein